MMYVHARARGLTPAVGMLLLCLSSCGKGTFEATLDDYLRRLGRPLKQDPAFVQVIGADPAPRAQALQIPLPSSSLDSLDFLKLRGCALQTTVARRNSSLGRVAPPSQRLLLELSFLREAPACIDYLRDDNQSDLADQLHEVMQQKRRLLPVLVFNATLGSLEYREFWSNDTLAGDYPTHTSSVVVTALERVSQDAIRWLAGDYRADEREFELALGDIAMGDGGQLQRAMQMQALRLDNANTMISQRLEQGPLCTDTRRLDAAPILRTVSQKFFIGAVQPWSSALNQRYHQLIPPIHSLENLLSDVLPDDYRRWQLARRQAFTDSLQAPARHVRSLQTLLGPCYSEFAPSQEYAP